MFLKKYKNHLFTHLKNHTVGVDHFDMKMSEDENQLILDYKNTPFKFVIRVSATDAQAFDCQYTLFSDHYPFSDFYPANSYTSIQEICEVFDGWIAEEVNEYLREQSEIDLWEEYKNVGGLLDIENVDFGNKSHFSFDEKMQINLAINDLKLLIQKKFLTSEKEQQLIVERLDYLAEASTRLNRFDWKNLAISTIISISIAMSLDTEKGKELFNLFKNVFRIVPQIFGHQ